LTLPPDLLAFPAMNSPEHPDSEPLTDTALAERVRATTELLERVTQDRGLLARLSPEVRHRLLKAAGEVYHPDVRARRRLVKETTKARKRATIQGEEAVLSGTGIRTLRRQTVFTTPNVFPPADFEAEDRHGEAPEPETIPSRHCYVCKEHFTTLHHFYDQLCPTCAEFNFAKRTELADLTGRVALLTGGRVKIGYQAGLKLLRCGAHLIVTTRFPRDSALRYAREPDFAEWGHRLEIFGLDLRHSPSVEAFCEELLATHDRLDFIINNACQTVRRPPDFYAHMMEGETGPLSDLPEAARQLVGRFEGLRGYNLLSRPAASDTVPVAPERLLSGMAGLTHSAELSQVPLLPEEEVSRAEHFPVGRLDQDEQQVDLRDHNSWRMLMAEVPTVELLEVQLVNAVAPFLINARLKPLMMRAPGRDKHVVNVSAVEGQFYRRFKTTRHPHTNMAKAALNMMTRTSAKDYHHDGIHMNSVDTGWVTDEDPEALAALKTAQHRFHPPLDIVDGAARIVDPIIHGIRTGEHVWGQFLKDYAPTDW